MNDGRRLSRPCYHGNPERPDVGSNAVSGSAFDCLWIYPFWLLVEEVGGWGCLVENAGKYDEVQVEAVEVGEAGVVDEGEDLVMLVERLVG